MADLHFKANLLPSATNTYSLGSSDLKWKNIYATTFTGALTGDVTGNATTATAATKLGTSNVGNLYTPIYLNAGVPTVTSGYTIEYIVGTQTAATNAWKGVTKDTALYVGKMIAYKLPVAGNSSAATLTLTLAGGSTTSAIAIKRKGTGNVTTHYSAGEVIFMAYDGTYWQVNADYYSDSTGLYIYSNGFRLTAGATNKVWKYSLFARLADGTYESFTTSSGTGTSKAKNTHGFIPDGKIYWNSANTDYSGVTNISAYEQYHSIDYRYTFNISTTGIPASAYTYVKWTYDPTDGLLYLADNWFATALPTSADGFIYQRIGSNYYASADYRGSLLLNNPYYVYRDGGIKSWTPSSQLIKYGSTLPTSGDFVGQVFILTA